MKTPLNYTGNKSRLIAQYSDIFPKKIGVFVDLFCGGGTVGLSVDSEKSIFIDNNFQVINLLQHLSSYDTHEILRRIEKLIDKYKLSYSARDGYGYYKKKISKPDNNGLKNINTTGYYQLRSDYNNLTKKNSTKALDMLYTLILYSFNNDMRFNRTGDFNLPIGKTDLNKKNIEKLDNFIKRVREKNCEFIFGDFRSPKVFDSLMDSDFIYADPPYLLGTAVYNEMGNWTEDTERELIAILELLNKKNKKFALSNILSKTGSRNKPLSDWIFKRNDLQIYDIKYNYKSASYNKINRDAKEREVLITNYTI